MVSTRSQSRSSNSRGATTSDPSPSPSKTKKENNSSKSTSGSDSVPLVGGFFLPKRQLFRALFLLFAVIGGGAFYGLAGSTKSAFLDFNGAFSKWRWPLHLFFFASWFGCSVWVSFVAGLVMFYSLPRHVFGQLQAKLFPRYFQFSVLCISVCLALEVCAAKFRGSSKCMPREQQMNLIAVWGILLLNLLYFEPVTTKVMFLRHAVERRLGTGHEVGQLRPWDPVKAKDPELVSLSARFGKLHGCSTSLNLLGLGLGCWHICWIGARL